MAKALKIAIQMDPMENVDINGDTTFALALNAHERGHEIFIYHATDLRMDSGHVAARGRRVKQLQRREGDHVAFAGGNEDIDLHKMDVVLIRQDPPFDMAYITAAHILERLQPDVLVLNNPAEIRNAPEKLFVTDFHDLTPPTLITRDEIAIRSFREKHGDIILKPLYGNGGAGVFRVKPDDQNFSSLLEMFQENYVEPLIAQAYLSDVRAGDKRIILLDGKPVGAINRIPAEGEARSNMHVGGQPAPIDLTDRDKEICQKIGPALSERGLIFTGIDVIGQYLTEINVTSPTGIQEVLRFGGADIAALHWDWVEARRR